MENIGKISHRVDSIEIGKTSVNKLLSEFTFDGNLSLRLKMIVYENSEFYRNMPTSFTADPELKQMENNRRLFAFDTGCFSDLVVSCEDEEFRVHKFMRVARSPVFDAMLRHDMVEKNSNNVRISDVDSRTIKSMFRYMYTDEVSFSTPEEALNLYATAKIYQMPYLVQKCAEFLASNLALCIIVDVLSLACVHDDDALKEFTMNFITSSFSNILNTSKWESFAEEYPVVASKILINISKRYIP